MYFFNIGFIFRKKMRQECILFLLFHLKVILMKLVTSRLLPHERYHNTTEFDAEHFCGLSKFTLILSFAFIITFYLLQFLSISLSFVFKTLASFAISFLLSVIFCSPHHRPFVDVIFFSSNEHLKN